MLELYSCGDGLQFKEGKWEFNEHVSNVFPIHARKSIPSYKLVHDTICTLVKTYSKDVDKYSILDLGCSVGELETDILCKNANRDIFITAVDNSKSMINKCMSNRLDDRVNFVCGDLISILESNNEKYDMVVCLYTMQFLDKESQSRIFSLVSNALNDRGVFILADKFKYCDSDIDMVKELELSNFKYSKGFSSEEIVGKSHALKGVQNKLIYSDINKSLGCGFKRIEVIDVSINFMCYAFYKN